MKINGAEWHLFLAEGWPEGWIYTDLPEMDDGRDVDDIPDDEVFTIPDWWSAEPEHDSDAGLAGRHPVLTIRTLIRRWRKTRGFVVLSVLVKKSDEARARALFAYSGWEILGGKRA